MPIRLSTRPLERLADMLMFACIALAIVLALSVAHAETAAPVVGATATTASPPIPIGQSVAEIGNVASAVLLPVIMALLAWAASHGPSWLAAVVAVMRTQRAQQLIQAAVDYGINAVEGATKDKTLDVQTGSKVLNQAVSYALTSGEAKLIAWMGGADGIKAKVFRALNLDATASAAAMDVRPPAS